jgi:hypothetical protein
MAGTSRSADPTLSTILDALRTVARPLMLKTFHRSDTCILASRVAVDVLSHYGYAASPHPVALMAANDVLWQAMQSGRDGPDVEAGGYSVGVPRNTSSRETKHLVVVLPAQLKMLISPWTNSADRTRASLFRRRGLASLRTGGTVRSKAFRSLRQTGFTSCMSMATGLRLRRQLTGSTRRPLRPLSGQPCLR